MGKEERIICFQDTLEKSNTGRLKSRTEQAVKSNRVYKEGFVSKSKHRNESTSVEVCSGTTFEIAKKYAHLGKIAVLNFANPENPGGGVQFGAMAQEECLCRSSNLFACISNPNIFNEYYGYHRNLKSRFYSDRLIYTKNVTVFKYDSPIPQMLPEKDWFDVDVITCAAPYLGGSKYTNLTVLRHLFQSRITNILEAALDNCVDTIILGAFGCGAFKNPAQLVAEEFRSVIENGQYCKKFKNIVFAIKKETEDDYGANYHTFATVLCFPLTENCPTYDLPEVILPTGKKIEKATVRFHRLPTNTTIEDVKDLVVAGEGSPETYNNNMEAFEKQRRFLRWQRNNPYYKKQFSVLGDSISTLDGYNPKGYKIFYENDNCVKSGVVTPQNTWWGKVIECFGGELLVNNSWSGSRVTKLPGREQLFPSGCSDERTTALHINDVYPDVIIVYLGTNDWAVGAETGEETRVLHADCNELFSEDYDSMLRKIKSNYPNAEIWCCTLCETYMSNSSGFTFSHKYGGTHIGEYNECIRSIVKRNGCRLIDLYQYKMPYDSIDGSHPTAAGMNTIATMMVRSMGEPEAERVLGCEDGQHDFCSPFAEDQDAKVLAILEAAMSTFAKSGYKDEVALKSIISALADVPLYLPVEIDLEAMLRSSDPTEVKAGRIITLKTEDGGAVVPMFTSNDEVNKGPSASVIRFYPQDYLPKLIQMDKPVMINPFSENRFVLPQQWITEVLLPAVEKKVKSAMNTVEQPAEKYIGKTIDGKYEVLKLIGRGGVYTVYLVRDIRNNKVWAMKVCDKTSPNYSSAMRENILTEPYMMQRLNHPSIPKVIDIIENDEALFIVRDYIEGETLETVVKMHGSQSADTVIEWGKQMCSVLGYLHSQNPPLVYSDMKPHNVILTPAGTLKLIGFGIMRTYKPNRKSDTCCLGAKGYAAPEQFGGSQTDARTDIFGLGMTMFRLVTGIDPNEPPYEIKPICSINPNLPKGLEYIISKCTQPNPAERYQSCDELMLDLNNYLSLPKSKGIMGKLFGKK